MHDLAHERDELRSELDDARTWLADLVFERDLARYELARLRRRRWSRLGRALVDALRRPWRLLALPFVVIRILFGQAPAAPDVPRRPDPEAANRFPAPREPRARLALRARYVATPTGRRLKDLRIAGVLDEFSQACFSPDCRLEASFRPDNWRESVEAFAPHLLLVESAWQGNAGAWEYQVGTYTYAGSVGLPPLTELVEWCRQQGIPTVFWNKEDPVHFRKFRQAAQLFDVVLTTDADQIGSYETLPRLRADVVDALPFAAQPQLHTPVAAPEREPTTAFAGAYYRDRHPDRARQLETLLDAALPYGLVIYDRSNGQVTESVGFPERYRPYIRPALPYEEMVETYRRHRVFLNVNSVTESPTMFSRRVFELLACGTPVVSTPSRGMQRLLGPVVTVAEDLDTATEAIESLLRDDTRWRAASMAGRRAVLRDHTYAHRLAYLAATAGLDVDVEPDRGVTIVLLGTGVEHAAQVAALARLHPDWPIVTEAGDQPLGPIHPAIIEVPRPGAEAGLARLMESVATPWTLLMPPTTELSLGLVADLELAPRMVDADVYGHADGMPDRFVTRLTPGAMLVRSEVAQRHLDLLVSPQHHPHLHARGVRLFSLAATG